VQGFLPAVGRLAKPTCAQACADGTVRAASARREAAPVTAALALAASLLWGVADYLGGSAGRRASVVAIALVSQAVGLVAIVVAALVVEPGRPGTTALAFGALAGVAGLVSAPCFYRALALGPMSVVAPIVATSACVPATWGLLRGDAAGALTVTAMVVALGGSALAARTPGASGSGGTWAAGVGLAVIAMLFLGLQLVLLGEGAAEGSPLWSVAAARTASVAGLVVIAAVLRPRIDRGLVRGVAPIGLLDTGANASFALAAESGSLAVAAVLGSLFPVVTVALAQARLGERLRGPQALGAALAIAGALTVVWSTT
jgi:drug/metabolite transporter (DMT)-like permease